MKTIDLVLKDFKHSFRSLFAIGMLFVMPLLNTGLIHVAFGGSLQDNQPAAIADFNVVVVNLDRPPAGAPALGDTLVEMLNDERMPDWLVVEPAEDESSARQAVDRQQAGAAVIIPADFTARLIKEDGQSVVRIVHDPTLSVGPAMIKLLIDQFAGEVTGSRIALAALNQAAAEHGAVLPPEVSQEALQAYQNWYIAFQQAQNHGGEGALVFRSPGVLEKETNPIQSIMGKIVAGMITFFVFFGAASAAQSILRESEEGTLARLFTTPTSRRRILSGKFLYVVALITVQTLVLMALSSLFFGVDWGQPLTVALVVLGLVVSAAGFGIFVISLLNTSRQAGPVMGVLFSVTGMLGGLMSAATSMPEGFDLVQKFVPQGWATAGWNQALAGGGAASVITPVLVMLAIGVVCFTLGLVKFQRRFA